MVFKSLQPNIHLPGHVAIWDFLFEGPTSCFAKHPPSELRGYQHALTGERIDYAQVKEATTHLSTALVRKYGLEPGQTVAIFSPNSVWYPVSVLATLRAGGVVSGASPAYNVEEMRYALEKAGAKLLMTVPGSIDVAVSAAEKAGISKDRVILMEGERGGFIALKQLVQVGASYGENGQLSSFKIPRGKPSKDVCAFLSFSSGTTGLPKAVMISHQNMIAQCLQIRMVTPPDLQKILALLPMFHIFGLVHVLHLPIVLNAEAYVLPSFTMKNLLETTLKHQLNELLLVPPTLIRLVRDPLVKQYDLSCVRRFSTGAAPLSEEILHLLQRDFPQTKFKQAYGLTESCSAITTHPPDKYDYKYGHAAGMICPSTEIKILGLDGEDRGINEPGEVLARGPQIVMGYLNNAKATAETFDEQGFLRTGDQGMIDDEGLLTITDRIKEMIKVKGFAVAPAELEDLLLGHPQVEDCAVLAVPDAYSGEVPKAYVSLKGRKQGSKEIGKELIRYVQKKKVRHKWLDGGISFVPSIPKSSSGKILRHVLRDRSNEQTVNGLTVTMEDFNKDSKL